ncbi:MAG: nitronate monooxygenase [Chloroflexota bacterium]|nr:nitronate monooxygenase [Chloroflexota bacterium]
MKRTRLCDLLGVEYPIIQGGMNWIANAELAAAVSNAGGLGVISPTARMKLEDDLEQNLRDEIRKTQGLTDRPFAVNFPLQTPDVDKLIEAAIELGVRVVTTSAGNPALYTARLKEAGLTVLHVVASVRHAQGAEKRGVDAVIAEGFEAGGHNGFDELSTFVLVPQVADAVSVPVVAAGGIADARGLVAALALGADGVQIGTRFVATHECAAHQNFKDEVVGAIDTGTVITGRRLGPTRGLKNEFTALLTEMEAAGATPEELLVTVGLGRSRSGELDGNTKDGELYCGSIAGMVTEIVGAADVVRSLVEGYDRVVAGL